jgi:hypothetical protein
MLRVGKLGRLAVVMMAVAICCSGSPVSTNTSAIPPTPEILSAALNNQLDLGCIQVDYSYAGDKSPAAATYRYVRGPAKQFLTQTLADGTVNTQMYDTHKCVGRYLIISQGKALGAVADSTQRDELGYARLMDPVLFNLPKGTLAGLIGKGQVSTAMEVAEGHSCWRVDIVPDPDKPKHKYVVFVDPDIGFCPRRVETYYAEGYSLVSILSGYKDLGNGIWFPTSMRLMPVYHGESAATREVTVSDVKSVDDQYVNSLRVEFPSGTAVRDWVMDADYTVP